MTDSTIVSYVGPNKPGLISKTMDCLTKLGGNIGDLSFATLGKGCECTLIYELSDETKKSDVEKALKKLDALSSGDLVVKDFEQDQVGDRDCTAQFLLRSCNLYSAIK